MVGPVVSRAWLAEHLDDVVLVEVDKDVDPTAYDGARLPVDLERWLSGPGTSEDGRHPLPAPEVFAEGMERSGIGDGDTVVAWDRSGGVFAARLVWMLRVTGHAAALLDGAPEVPPRTAPGAARLTPRPWPAGVLAGVDDVLDPRNVVLDARPRERFLGAPDPLDPRPGHIPGARSVPCRESLDDDGLLLPVDVLRARFVAAGADGRAPVVSSCGSGVTACHNLLVLEHVGLGSGRLYVGSWSQYASDPDRPVELTEG